LVDTGFSGHIQVPSLRGVTAVSSGVILRESSATIAGGTNVRTKVTYGQVSKVEGHTPSQPIGIVLTFYGKANHGLVGREFLKGWIAEFDGPKSLMTIFKETP
jgi:predicted aspartyl protease